MAAPRRSQRVLAAKPKETAENCVSDNTKYSTATNNKKKLGAHAKSPKKAGKRKLSVTVPHNRLRPATPRLTKKPRVTKSWHRDFAAVDEIWSDIPTTNMQLSQRQISCINRDLQHWGISVVEQSKGEISEYKFEAIRGKSSTWAMGQLAEAAEDVKTAKADTMKTEVLEKGTMDGEMAKFMEECTEKRLEKEQEDDEMTECDEEDDDAETKQPSVEDRPRPRQGRGPPLGVFTLDERDLKLGFGPQMGASFKRERTGDSSG
jgi:hypothetical protein